jgi:hypothetical protein
VNVPATLVEENVLDTFIERSVLATEVGWAWWIPNLYYSLYTIR